MLHSFKRGSVRLDYLTVTARGGSWRQSYVAAREWGTALWGEPTRCSGQALGYRSGWRWATNARLLVDPIDGGEQCTLQLSGGCLDEWTVKEQPQLLVELFGMGFVRCSRVDLALDIYGDRISLIDLLRHSARNGRVRRVRKWRGHDGSDEHGIYLGSRQSPRGVRVYDKGQETGTRPRGQWVRVEAEVKNASQYQLAQCVFDRLVSEAMSERPGVRFDFDEQLPKLMGFQQFILSYVVHSIDVGRPGPRVGNVRTWVRDPWWSRCVDGIQKVVLRVGRRVAASLDRTAAWLRRCVVPVLGRCSCASGRDPLTVLFDLVGELAPVFGRPTAASHQYALAYGAPRPPPSESLPRRPASCTKPV